MITIVLLIIVNFCLQVSLTLLSLQVQHIIQFVHASPSPSSMKIVGFTAVCRTNEGFRFRTKLSKGITRTNREGKNGISNLMKRNIN